MLGQTATNVKLYLPSRTSNPEVGTPNPGVRLYHKASKEVWAGRVEIPKAVAIAVKRADAQKSLSALRERLQEKASRTVAGPV